MSRLEDAAAWFRTHKDSGHPVRVVRVEETRTSEFTSMAACDEDHTLMRFTPCFTCLWDPLARAGGEK